MKISPFIAALIAFVPAALFAMDPLTFKLKGLGIGATKSELSELLNTAKKSKDLSVDSAGIEVFDIIDDSSAPAKVTITFLDDKAVQIVGDYTIAEVERIGGLESILERLKEKLGPPSDDVVRNQLLGDTMILIAASWRKPLISRLFVFGSERNAGKVKTTLILIDLSKDLAERRKKSTSAGF